MLKSSHFICKGVFHSHFCLVYFESFRLEEPSEIEFSLSSALPRPPCPVPKCHLHRGLNPCRDGDCSTVPGLDKPLQEGISPISKACCSAGSKPTKPSLQICCRHNPSSPSQLSRDSREICIYSSSWVKTEYFVIFPSNFQLRLFSHSYVLLQHRFAVSLSWLPLTASICVNPLHPHPYFYIYNKANCWRII